MRLIVFVLPLFGHIFQAKAIVSSLQRLGFDLTIVCSQAFESYFEGFKIISIEIPTFALKKGSVWFSVPQRFLKRFQLIFDDILRETDSLVFDGVLYDAMAIWAHYFAKMRSLPSVSLNTMLHIHSKNWSNLVKSEGDYFWDDPISNLKLCWEYYGDIYKLRNKTGITGPNILNYFSGSADLLLSSCLKKLTVKPILPSVHFIGLDIVEQKWDMGFDPEWYTKPCMFLSLGSMNEPSLEEIQLWIEIFADKPYKLLIKAKTTQITALPSNVRLTPFANQHEVLRRSSLFINHGGLNGLLEAAAFKVPVIICPSWTDSHHNAKEIFSQGAGLIVSRKHPHDLTIAVEKILENIESFTENMQKLNMKNIKAGGSEKAARLISSLIKPR